MGQFGNKLRKSTIGYSHWCTGCEEMHHIQVTSPSGINWKFNNDPDMPDFKPSVKITYPGMSTEECSEWKLVVCCHYFIDNGHINYCSDSTHSLSGQSILLPDLPPEHRDDYEEPSP